jgi:tRNA(Glu) U13 pseudouridine synthase TruD
MADDETLIWRNRQLLAEAEATRSTAQETAERAVEARQAAENRRKRLRKVLLSAARGAVWPRFLRRRLRSPT